MELVSNNYYLSILKWWCMYHPLISFWSHLFSLAFLPAFRSEISSFIASAFSFFKALYWACFTPSSPHHRHLLSCLPLANCTRHKDRAISRWFHVPQALHPQSTYHHLCHSPLASWSKALPTYWIFSTGSLSILWSGVQSYDLRCSLVLKQSASSELCSWRLLDGLNRSWISYCLRLGS